MVCVWGSPLVGLAGCDAGGAPGWAASGLLAGGRAWTRQVVSGVVEPGHRWGPRLGPFSGAWC